MTGRVCCGSCMLLNFLTGCCCRALPTTTPFRTANDATSTILFPWLIWQGKFPKESANLRLHQLPWRPTQTNLNLPHQSGTRCFLILTSSSNIIPSAQDGQSAFHSLSLLFNGTSKLGIESRGWCMSSLALNWPYSCGEWWCWSFLPGLWIKSVSVSSSNKDSRRPATLCFSHHSHNGTHKNSISIS